MGEPAPRRRVVKKSSGGHGHHGGAWKVAYADFVTAMMALFMVMWLLASTDQKTRHEISNYFRTGVLPDGDLAMKTAAKITPSVIEEAANEPSERTETIDNTAVDVRNKVSQLASINPELADVIKNVHVEVTDEGVLIEVIDEDRGLLFDLSSARLKEPLERFLRAISGILVSTGAPIEIDGHTDARPFAAGAKLSNWDLSYQRASAARDILVASGLPESRVYGVFARGSSQPFVKDDPMSPKNRRLSILVRIAKTGGAPAQPAP